MELWDIYDENKERTGATMKHNDWNIDRKSTRLNSSHSV